MSMPQIALYLSPTSHGHDDFSELPVLCPICGIDVKNAIRRVDFSVSCPSRYFLIELDGVTYDNDER